VQRDDIEVLDEPLYAHYLRQKPNVCHPSQEEVLQQQVSLRGERERDVAPPVPVVRFNPRGFLFAECFHELQENVGDKVVREIIHGPCKKKYRYCKVSL
jgi:hypothetical protein